MPIKGKTEKIVFGLDLGQSKDYTAICGVEVVKKMGEYNMVIRYLKRWPLNTGYPDIVKDVKRLIINTRETQKKNPFLVIDYTGVGRPVFDMFKSIGLEPKGINIHGGNTVTREGGVYNVPKRDLVGVLQVLYQNERIKISGDLKEKDTLNKELLNFKVKITDSGQDTYSAWRERDHDDLVLAVTCACWYGNKKSQWGW